VIAAICPPKPPLMISSTATICPPKPPLMMISSDCDYLPSKTATDIDFKHCHYLLSKTATCNDFKHCHFLLSQIVTDNDFMALPLQLLNHHTWFSGRPHLSKASISEHQAVIISDRNVMKTRTGR